MKKYLLLLLFLSTSSYGGFFEKSPKWELFNKTDYDLIKLDVNSVKTKGDYVSFWYVNEMNRFPGKYFLWKEVYDCKKRKGMSLFYEVVKSIDTLPKNIPDLTDEDRWMDVTNNLWDSKVFSQLCEPTIKKSFF